MDNPDRERAFHLESWRIAPAMAQPVDGTLVMDDLDREICTFRGEHHRANANRVLKALSAPETRKREAVNFAVRDLIRVNRRLKAKLSVKHEQVTAFVNFLRAAVFAAKRNEKG